MTIVRVMKEEMGAGMLNDKKINVIRTVKIMLELSRVDAWNVRTMV